jgi:hypothetical protein
VHFPAIWRGVGLIGLIKNPWRQSIRDYKTAADEAAARKIQAGESHPFIFSSASVAWS